VPDVNDFERLIRQIGKLGFLKANLLQILMWPAVCLILGAFLWYAALGKIDAERIEVRNNALIQASSDAHAYAQYVERALQQTDQITMRIKYAWERSRGKPNLTELAASGFFRDPQVVLALVVNRNRIPLTVAPYAKQKFKRMSLADADYFRFHQNDRSNILLIGKPVLGRITGKKVVSLTRRLNAADGSFDGVVLVSVTPDYFASFYAGSNAGKTGLLAVAGNDGALRAARIGNGLQEPPLRAFRAIPLFDTLQGSALLDGKRWFVDDRTRFVGWETLKTYPLVVMAGIADQELLAPHQKTWALYRKQAVAGSVALFLLSLAGMGWSARLAWRKSHSEEVRQAYRITTEGSNEGFYMLEAMRDKHNAIVDFKVVDCNEHGAAFYRFSKAQMLHVNISTLYHGPVFDTFMDTYRKAMASGFYEDEYERPEGSPITIRWLRRKLVRFGNVLAVTVEDISERKQTEETLRHHEAELLLFRAAMDATQDAIYLVDRASMCFIDVNEAACRMQERPREELLALGPQDVLSVSRKELERIYDSVISGGHTESVTRQRVRNDGSPIWVELQRSAMRSDMGWMIVTVARDITKLKLAEAELNALNAQLEDRIAQRTAALESANKELETFSYSISHDLRVPLRHIAGFSAIVLKENEGKLDEVSVDYLSRIEAAGQRMGLLIDDLLALSRVSRQELRTRDFDLSELAGQVADTLAKTHPDREVRVTVKPEMKTLGDPGMVRIVLENLIGNAWKFTSRTNEPRIEVGSDERDGKVIFCVRDNGAGFDMKYADKLFAPFQRLHTDKEFEGTGIGLSIVHRIVARHGGRIWAESEVGKGTAFYLTLS